MGMAAGSNLEGVYSDLTNIRDMMVESEDFRLMVQTPGIQPEAKIVALEAICQQAGTDGAVVNFLKVLVENKRMDKLPRMIEIFEGFYRAEKGLIACEVTSASELSSSEKSSVQSAMESRAPAGSTVLMEYKTNPAILGGLVVKFGDAVLDQSVSTRLERMTAQLLA